MSQLMQHLTNLLSKAKQENERQKLRGLIAVHQELIAQDLRSDGKEHVTSVLPFSYCLEIYLGYKQDFVSGSLITKDDKVAFQDCLLNQKYGLCVYVVSSKNGTKFVALRPDELDLTDIFHELINDSTTQTKMDKFPLTKDVLKCILSTLDTEWDKKVATMLFASNRSYSELDSLGVDTDSICANTTKVLEVTNEWQNAIVAAEDSISLRLKQKLVYCQNNLEALKAKKQQKEDTWSRGMRVIDENIEQLQERVQGTEGLLNDMTGQKSKQMIKRKAKQLFEENRFKQRARSTQGRKRLLDDEDEEFIAKCIEDKATYHGRRDDTVMYTNKRVKKEDLLSIANYKLRERGKKLIKSANTVYNRSRPRNMRSVQAKRHSGKGLFCFKKPPKAEDCGNENTHYQRAHVKNIKLSFFSSQAEEAKHLCFMRSTDDKAYLRPGTSEGFDKARNTQILTVVDVEKARVLPKYDWPEKLVYITPAAHRIFTKKGVMEDDKEVLVTEEDHHIVYVRPKAIVGSSGSVWASETVNLRHRSPDMFEIVSKEQVYTQDFRSVCAEIHDYLFQYVDMTELDDLKKVTSQKECPHRSYEHQRVEHAQHGVQHAIEKASSSTLMTEAEKMVLASRIIPALSQIEESFGNLQKLLSPTRAIDAKEIVTVNDRLKDVCTQVFETFADLQLPKVKPRWADLTDAGPGVGVSNNLVRFRDAELARLYGSDYRVRCHRSRGDSGQGEAERTNSAIGDAVIDGATIHWEKEKCFQGMTEEQIKSMTVKDFQKYEKSRMERNAWEVATEVAKRIDDAPVLSEYITAYVSKKPENHFFFNEDNISKFFKTKSSESIPGNTYMLKIAKFIEIHYQFGELYMEYLKESCKKNLDGKLCDFCESCSLVGPPFQRIPQPIPDPENPAHYMDVFSTPSTNTDGSPRKPDDWQPRAQLKHCFYSNKITLSDTDSIKEFAKEFAVDEKYVRTYIEHLNILKLKDTIRKQQRKADKHGRDSKRYEDYDWLDMVLKGTLKQLLVAELNKYLVHHGLLTAGRKNDKIETVTCHVLRSKSNKEIEKKKTEETNTDDSESGSSDESDSDYIVATFGSDREDDVPDE